MYVDQVRKFDVTVYIAIFARTLFNANPCWSASYGADLIRLPNTYYSMATLHRSMFLIKSGNKILPHWIISIPKVDV